MTGLVIKKKYIQSPGIENLTITIFKLCDFYKGMYLHLYFILSFESVARKEKSRILTGDKLFFPFNYFEGTVSGKLIHIEKLIHKLLDKLSPQNELS